MNVQQVAIEQPFIIHNDDDNLMMMKDTLRVMVKNKQQSPNLRMSLESILFV